MADTYTPSNLESEKLPTPKRKRTWHRFMKNVGTPWLFIVPIILLHLFVVAFPAALSVYYSFTEWSGINEPEWVGFENYRKILFDDPQVWSAFGHNVIWLAFFLTVPFVVALFAASLLAQVKRGAMIYRTLLFIPFILPSVVTASIWRNLLNPRLGVLAQIGDWTGIEAFKIALLGRSSTALVTIAYIDHWHWWGFLMILFLTAMQAIPVVLYDAAKIDGVNKWQEFWNVTFPGIRPTVLFMFMMSAIWAFLAFDYIWILTQGGPAGSSDVMATVLYRNAFARFEAGYAAAQGLTLSFLAGFIVLIFIILRRRGWEI